MGSFNQVGHNPGGTIPVGTVTLVSPTRIAIDGTLAQRRTVSLTTLKMVFAPEPGTLLLLGAGAALLALYGKAR
jgi:hypothetical protein